MENKYTFWKIINEYKIQIPIIQRDYAQGRVTERKIAEKFIDDICYALVNDNPLNLDFIYGKTANSVLIPLDGQQRLTTLFLLHWYLAFIENKLADKKEILNKFTYETRLSSQDFCKKLINEGVENLDDENISSKIRNSRWYYFSWQNDPTVSAMLNMLDIIHNKFFKMDIIFDKLICEIKSPITFNFLPLEHFQLSDELYIKMNARGKPLTAFENFKSQFIKLLDQEFQVSKLDNEWLDIFWKIKKMSNKKKEMDDTISREAEESYYNFFQNATLNLYVENEKLDKNLINKDFIDNYDIIDIYQHVYSSTVSKSNIGKCLNALEGYLDDQKVFECAIRSKDKITYWDRVRFYALMRFFILYGEINSDNKRDYLRWMRITKNLINNTLIQGPDEFVNAIVSIKELSLNINNIYDYIADEKNIKKIRFFLREQIEEEKIKIKLISQDNTWEKLILEIERHEYFDGQIGFILEYVKDQKGLYNIAKFEDYSCKLEKIFSDFKNNKEFMFERALLVHGDYLIDSGRSNKNFCNFETALRTKNDNWRKFFKDRVKTLYLKNLLEQISLNHIERDLKKIIKENKVQDWRKYFVDNPEYINYCKKRCIRPEGSKIYLLSKEQKNSIHRELSSYALYTRLKKKNDYKPFAKIEYRESASHDEPYIQLSDWKLDNVIISIKIEFNKDFNLELLPSIDKIPNKLSNILKILNFNKNIKKIPIKGVDNKLNEILSKMRLL